jgi:integrase
MVAVKEQLGHSSINVTVDIYGHWTEDMQRQTAQIMNDLFGNRQNDLETTS